LPMELPVRTKFVGTLKTRRAPHNTVYDEQSYDEQSRIFVTCACALTVFIFSSRHRILSIFARRRRWVSDADADADANPNAVESHAPDA
jgi:hypothetical protein